VQNTREYIKIHNAYTIHPTASERQYTYRDTLLYILSVWSLQPGCSFSEQRARE